jgi:uncharacterized LabA/DUF88 family protein
MKVERISCFVDGFNMYHAIDDLKQDHLKWLNLRALLERFAAQPNQKVTAIYYFSAYATWLPDAYARHREYVRALQAVGIIPIMGHFKDKDRSCHNCKIKWTAHEEKETDVNVALYMLNEAYKNTFDHAFLVSNDSDLAPVVRMMRKEFPQKRLRLITPPGRRSSKELVSEAGGLGFMRSIKPNHLARFLFQTQVKDASGTRAATCPPKYLPPGITP